MRTGAPGRMQSAPSQADDASSPAARPSLRTPRARRRWIVPVAGRISPVVDEQLDIFAPGPALPEGFRYRPEVVPRDEEPPLVESLRGLPFREFEFHGYRGRRRVVSFGWRYDFERRTIDRAEDVPPFLLALRERAARFAGLSPADLQHVLVTEYDVGAGIGWHRDKAAFGDVVGVSLLAPCTFRLRRPRPGGGWERASIVAEPRSAYLLRGPSRTEWEHSIPPVEALRYSVTFRNLREARRRSPSR